MFKLLAKTCIFELLLKILLSIFVRRIIVLLPVDIEGARRFAYIVSFRFELFEWLEKHVLHQIGYSLAAITLKEKFNLIRFSKSLRQVSKKIEVYHITSIECKCCT